MMGPSLQGRRHRTIRARMFVGAALLAPVLLLSSGFAQKPASPSPAPSGVRASPTALPSPTPTEEPGFPVTVDGQTLFRVSERVGSFNARQRADVISSRIQELARHPISERLTVHLVDLLSSTDIVAGDVVIMSVTDADAAAATVPRRELAARFARVIRSAVDEARTVYGLRALLIDVGLAFVVTILFFAFLRLIRTLFPMVLDKIESWRGTVIRPIRIQRLELLSAERFTDALEAVLSLIRITAIIAAFFIWIAVVLSLFPWTRSYTRIFLGYLLVPLRSLFLSFINYLPDLFFLVVIIGITWYAIKLVHLIFTEIGKGTIVIPDFDAEWAEPTYKIARILIIAFAVVIAFPYLPGSQSPAFKGVSIFLGVLLSLGSSSAVSNVVAGVVLTYTRAFRLGDRVKISDTVGDVTEKTLLVTRIRTVKNVDITIPNAMVLASHIINFSASARREGLILHTSVTLGYDLDWRKAHGHLIAAAKATAGIIEFPEPFVLQTSLDDSYVTYEINAYTDQPWRMALIYSELHQRIQDGFRGAGLEIMSPHYSAIRDGNPMAIPAENLPAGYEPPPFRVRRD